MSILAAHNEDDAPVDWADVVEANEPSLRRLIAKRMANRELVDDALQETYLRAVRSCHLRRVTPDGRWLRTVARRASTDLYRGEPPPMADFDALVLVADGMLPGSDEHLDSVERQQALRWSLARLTPRHRRLLALRGVHDLTYQEIGRLENLTEEAVTAALNRARTRLRAHLYAYENRGSGAAVGLWLGNWLRRLRWRLQEMGPRAMEWAGATLTVGVVAAIVATPVHAPASNNPAVVVGSNWTAAGYVDSLAAFMSPSTVEGNVVASAAGAPAVVPEHVGPSAPRPLIDSRSDFNVGTDEATFSYTLRINDPTGGGNTTEVDVQVPCRGPTSRRACDALGTVPEP